MPKTHISRSQFINAPVEKVYDVVADLGQWQAWSPWLIMEPEAEVSVTDGGKSYTWRGNRVGEGGMSVTSEEHGRAVHYDLNFLKPFKSQADVSMTTHAQDGGTLVTWTMDSKLPFFLFFMKKSMETFVGMDYERGLKMLKDYVEDGQVHSKLNFIGLNQYDGTHYVGLRRQSSIEDMPNLMQQDFGRVMAWSAENGGSPEDGFSIYHDYNPLKGRCDFTSAVRVKTLPTDLPDGFISGEQVRSKIYTLEHVGPYEHLGNAWATLYNLIRSKDIKPVKGYPPFETYGNSPTDTAPKDLITRINFAVK